MYLSFDLGGTNIKAGIIDDAGDIKLQTTIATQVAGGPEEVFKQFSELASYLLHGTNLSRKEVKGVGVGIPGFVQVADGMVIHAPNLYWRNIPVKNKLEEYLKYPVYVINDANAAALGELWKGAGQNKTNILCVTLGTGIGAGIIIDGKIINGSKGLAGEIGHFLVNLQQGRRCNCGKIGCLETEASGSALAYYGKQAVLQGEKTLLTDLMDSEKKLTSKDIAEAAVRGDRVAIEIIDRAAYYLGLALANIYLTIEPEKILIGGGVARAGQALFVPLFKWFKQFSLSHIEANRVIAPAKLGNDAGIIGLAKYVKQNI